MLSEESLVLIAVFVACGLVALGALELVWPTRPRHPERRHPPVEALRPARSRVTMPLPPPWRVPERAVVTPAVAAGSTERESLADVVVPGSHERESPIEVVAGTFPEVDVPAEVVAGTSPEIDAPAEVVAVVPPEGESPIAVVPAAPLDNESPIPLVAAAPPQSDSPPTLRIVPPAGEREVTRRERPRGVRPRPLPRPLPRPSRAEKPEEGAGPRAVPPSVGAPTETPAGPMREASIVERCYTLFKADRLAEVVTLAEEALRAQRSDAVSAPSPAAAQETARLWGVVGLAKQGLDDFEGARFALEEAIAVAPRTERPTWERHLASLALTVGRQSLGDDEAEPPRPARVDSLRSAIDWLERGLVAAPDDAGLREALAAAREALWPTYEAVVKALVQRQELGEARRILDEVVGDPDCPPDRQDAFRKLLSSAIGSEIGHATAEALRHLQRGREDDASAALARAETIIAGLAPDALPARRRQELERRLWWGYMKLGGNRVEAGAREAAMGPLFRALSFAEGGSEQQDATRSMLARAIGELVDERAGEIGRLIETGDTGTASAESDKLWSLIRGAVDQGLPEDDVLGPFDKVLAFYRRIGAKRA